MTPRRAQPPITIRSQIAKNRLAVLTRNGRSQAEVIEEALRRMPDPPLPPYRPELTEEDRVQVERLKAITASIPPGSFPSMAEFDALEYDEDGLPR